MKKTILVLVCIFTMMMQKQINTLASSSEQTSENIGFGELFHINHVIIDNIDNKLFPEFDNNDKALAHFYKNHSNFLDELSIKGNLSRFSVDNYKIYSDLNYYLIEQDSMLIQNVWYQNESNAMMAFIDILENKEVNEQILKTIHMKDSNPAKEEMLLSLMPYDSEFVKNHQLTKGKDVNAKFNKTQGITYAATYCSIPNIIGYYYNQDCTNFASQIMEAGGMSQVNTGSIYSGWWHTIANNHARSNSWALANSFINYFGTVIVTTSNYSFSTHISAGSFVALDYAGDGSWDHIGFVTNVQSSISSSLGYKNYRIAQHSSNYNAWASSQTNSWETYSNGTSRYGIVNY